MTSETVSFFDAILRDGLAESTYDQYVHDNIRRPPASQSSFYTRKRTEEGVVAAEAAFAQWERLRRMRDFAFAVEPIVRGMRALALRKEAHAQVRGWDPQTTYPIANNSPRATTQTALLINPEFPGCGCSAPKGGDVFSRNFGSLGLRALTLQIDHPPNSPHGKKSEVSVGLVLPRWGLGGRVKANAYVVVTMEANGYTNQHVYQPVTDIETGVRYSLGMISAEEAGLKPGNKLFASWSDGHLDQALGFPGALNYLADEIQHLGPYLTELAARLSGEHTHGHGKEVSG